MQLLSNFTRQVEMKAYELYMKRGSAFGHEWDDWFEAEKIVGSQISTIDRDCIRSESFYKSYHRLDPLPSEIEAKK